MISRIALLCGIVVLAASCADQREATRLVGPEAMISDAVHEGGTSGFFFLPPMVAQPTVSGTFDAEIATLSPQIAICDVTNDVNCGGSSATLAVFATATSPGITVDPAAQQYQVNWDTKGASFVAGKTYRVHVTAGVPGARRELGFADVLLTTTPGQAKSLQSGDIIVLPDGRTLPIHLRIETGIPGSLAASAATASVTSGGTDLITAAVSDLHGAPLAGATVAWSLTTTPATGVADATQPLNPTSGQTGTLGTTATAFKAGTTAGTALVTASSTGVAATATVTVRSGRPLYIANYDVNSITVYPTGTSGNATPTATIVGDNTGLGQPHGIALDGTGNIYVANGLSITVYAPGANGNARPAATIAGDATALDGSCGIALDGAGNIYVTNFFNNSVTVYAA